MIKDKDLLDIFENKQDLISQKIRLKHVHKKIMKELLIVLKRLSYYKDPLSSLSKYHSYNLQQISKNRQIALKQYNAYLKSEQRDPDRLLEIEKILKNIIKLQNKLESIENLKHLIHRKNELLKQKWDIEYRIYLLESLL